MAFSASAGTVSIDYLEVSYLCIISSILQQEPPGGVSGRKVQILYHKYRSPHLRTQISLFTTYPKKFFIYLDFFFLTSSLNLYK